MNDLVKLIQELDQDALWQISSPTAEVPSSDFNIDWSGVPVSFKSNDGILTRRFTKPDGTETPSLPLVHVRQSRSNGQNSVFSLPNQNTDLYRFISERGRYSDSKLSFFRNFNEIYAKSIDVFNSNFVNRRFDMTRFDLKVALDVNQVLMDLDTRLNPRLELQKSRLRLDPVGNFDLVKEYQAELEAKLDIGLAHYFSFLTSTFGFMIQQPDTGLNIMMGVLADAEAAPVPAPTPKP